VFVWQRTNVLPNQTALFYANPDPDSVYLYLWNADEELLVDKDKNGVCDDISMDIAKDARVQKLAPLKVEGAPNSFGDDPYPNTPPLEGCTLVKPATSAPTSLCGGASDMFRVVGQKIGGTPVTAVYAKPEFGANTCTGRDWEFGSLQGDFKVKEGWICVAARASDEVGNTGVSAPLRLCYDDPVTGFEPSCTLENMPECTKDCTPPAEEDDYFIIDI
jgi:hypothetical protein